MYKNKTTRADFVNGQPKYSSDARANQKAVGYNLGKSQAKLNEDKKKIDQAKQMLQLQAMQLEQEKASLLAMKQQLEASIQSMPPPNMPPEMMAMNMMSGGMPRGGSPQQGMPPDQGMVPQGMM